MQRITFLLILQVVFIGCVSHPGNQTLRPSSNHYARSFEMDKQGDVTRLTVFNPWEKARGVSIEYYLINENKTIPDSLLAKKVIRTPVKRMVCMSTSHLGFIDILGENESVVGVSGSLYVTNPEIRQRLEDGRAVDVGYGQNLNYELIVNQQPDVVMVYGVGSEVAEYSKKIEELGIPVIMNAEYLEETPLGKAEWIKFMGAFYEKEDEAESFFAEVEKNYLALKKLVEKKEPKPTILVGSPYNDSWWVPGGNSYMANLIGDAGGDYLGKLNSSHESYVISFENALTWGNSADIWINMANLASKKEILAADVRFKSFRVFNEGRIFNNNKRLSIYGGNDFWESGTARPDLVLRDLATVFYPGLIQEEMIYYQEIK
jgi:iron complex transport system substrate-binding protein